MKKIVLILTFLFVSLIGYSQTFIENNITYKIINSTNNVEIDDYDIAGGAVLTIPETVTNTATGNVYNVTEIDNLAFYNKALTSVIIPDNVITIGSDAFRGNQLTSVVFGIGLTSIGSQSFMDNKLESIIIPNNVTSIGQTAFAINHLTSITISNNVTVIEQQTFRNNLLTNVIIPNNVTSIGVNAFSTNQLTSITIGDNVTSIGNNAFQTNQLTNLKIPNSVTSIGTYAFSTNPLNTIITEGTTPPTIFTGVPDTFNSRSNIDLFIPSGTSGAYITDTGALWTGFKSITEGIALAVGDTFIKNSITYEITTYTPNTVKIIDYNTSGGTVVNIPGTVSNGFTNFSVSSIGTAAFSQNQLTSITIPNTVTTIGDDAFEYNQLSILILPNSIISIGVAAFRDNNLNDIIFSTSLTTIEDVAFFNNNLSTIIIPDNITSIGPSAFKSNTSLSSITFSNNLISVGTSSFQNCNIDVINLPNSLISISNSAFRFNNISSIIIPENVTSIGTSAFKDNPLTDVFSNSFTPPTITTVNNNNNNDSFINNRSNINLTIPNGTIGVYVTDAGALWTGFKTVNGAVLNTVDFEFSNTIKVITNAEELKVTFSNNLRLQNYSVYTISGVEVSKGNENIIPTSFLSKGIYILKLNFNKGTFTKKILIK